MLTDAGVEKAERAFKLDNYADADQYGSSTLCNSSLKS